MLKIGTCNTGPADTASNAMNPKLVNAGLRLRCAASIASLRISSFATVRLLSPTVARHDKDRTVRRTNQIFGGAANQCVAQAGVAVR